MSSKILVYGWYHQGNVGDDLFINAYQHLFPDLEFVFSEIIVESQLKDIDAVFFGGGSFLLDRPRITEAALQLLKNKKIFYLGVGVETNIHPIHLQLMSRASLIAIRSPDQLDKIKSINQNVHCIPDLVYSLQEKIDRSPRIKGSVLIVPNVAIVPHRADPHWKHAAWTYFKSEFAQFLDWLIDNNYIPHFFTMCDGVELNDNWVSCELVSHMVHRNNKLILDKQLHTIDQVTKLFSEHEVVITQRFHGIVLSEMTRTPYIAIHHHDKLKFSQPGEGKFLSYYNCSKSSLIQNFYQAREMNYASILPIETNIFKTLVDDVKNLL